MFNITLKRPLVTLAVTAGLLVAAAGPANAAPIYMHFNDFRGGSGSTATLDSYTDASRVTPFGEPDLSVLDPILAEPDGFQGGCASTPTEDWSVSKGSKDQSSGIPASAGAPLSYTLEDCMISGWS